MKSVLIFLVLLSSLSFLNLSLAEETQIEKAKVEINTLGRKTKKTLNRTKETLCGKLTGDNKAECLAKKAKHRIEEGSAAIEDKATEIKDKVDTEK